MLSAFIARALDRQTQAEVVLKVIPKEWAHCAKAEITTYQWLLSSSEQHFLKLIKVGLASEVLYFLVFPKKGPSLHYKAPLDLKDVKEVAIHTVRVQPRLPLCFLEGTQYFSGDIPRNAPRPGLVPPRHQAGQHHLRERCLDPSDAPHRFWLGGAISTRRRPAARASSRSGRGDARVLQYSV